MVITTHTSTVGKWNTTTNTTEAVNSTTLPTLTTTHIYENAAPVTLLFVFGVVGNCIALSVLCCSAKTHKWRPFYRFVCGLAISDGGGILASYPFAMYRYISKFQYDFPEPLCEKELRTNITLGSVWCLSGILSSLHLYGLGSSKNIYPGSWCFLNFIDLEPWKPKATQNIIYSFIYAITGVIVVLLTIIINTAVIFFFVRNNARGKKSHRHDLHVIVFLLVIVTVFTSCWAPLMVNILQHASGSIHGEGPTELNFVRMAVMNSVVDPWIYILFRKEVLLLVITALERLTGRQFHMKRGLMGFPETGDSNKTPATPRATPTSDPLHATVTASSDDGGVYKG
ncbi:prostaglandin E2 receptor EP4 subtype-like isoform X2 [Ostrea edulis]|uniref:prostaglandin E2 receptor EP4 subtype-like isoform X2 n=1 Tax=Ostrea edulis TaxID=37623 RepID=UPI0024AF0EC8|nr:prostaglandin E2 receptor EP4 subtype-like isoform X2 [Ostrea edulis]